MTKMMRTMKSVSTILLAGTALVAAGAADARQGIVRARGADGAVTAVRGPQGNRLVRGHRTLTNDDGSITRQRVAIRDTARATTQRRGETMVDSAGSAYQSDRTRTRSTARGGTGTRDIQSQGTIAEGGSRSMTSSASGRAGTYSATGSARWSADGTREGSRSTSATSNRTGNSYAGSTYRDPATGRLVHQSTCRDAQGNTISCRR